MHQENMYIKDCFGEYKLNHTFYCIKTHISCMLLLKTNLMMTLDDTRWLYFIPQDINEMIIIRELYKVSTWLLANKLALNVSKTKFIMFRTLNKGIHYPMLKLNDTTIERVDRFKFLGIWLDEYLNWGAHIDHVCLKISRMNGTLNRLKHQCPQTVLMILYNTLILPYINYGILLWVQR